MPNNRLSVPLAFLPLPGFFGELSPSFGNKPAWLALDEDGPPLGEGTDAGVDLVVPDDVKAGRWVHSAARVSVVDEAAVNASGSR